MDQNQQEKRKDEFMRSIDITDQRRRLDVYSVQLRVQKRHEFQHKRRLQPSLDHLNSALYSSSLIAACPLLSDVTLSTTYKLSLIKQTLKDPYLCLDSLTSLRNIMTKSKSTDSYGDIVSLGFVPVLISYLDWKFPIKTVKEAAWCLANIASLTDYTDEIVCQDGILALMSSTNLKLGDVNEFTFLALGNIVGERADYRDKAIRLGFADLISDFVNANCIEIDVLRNVTWAMSNATKLKPYLEIAYIRVFADCCKKLLMTVHDKEVKTNAMWCLSYLADCGENPIQELIDRDLHRVILSHLKKSKLKSRLQASLRTIGNILTGTNAQTQRLLDIGLLEDLFKFLENNHLWSLHEIMWCLSNITGGTRQQVQEVLKHPIMNYVLETLLSADTLSRKEASYVCKNIARLGSSKDLLFLASKGIIMKLQTALTSHCAVTVSVSPNQNLMVTVLAMLRAAEEVKAVDSSDNFVCDLLNEAGVLRVIENMQSHSNVSVYTMAITVLREFFGYEDANFSEVCSEVPMYFAFS